MLIRMVSRLGGKYDHRPWPPPGGEIYVSDEDGQGLIAGGHAVDARRPSATVTMPATVVSEPALTAAGPVTPPELDGPVPPAVQVPETPPAAPAPADPKQAWIDWAVSQGADPDEAAAMTKADLMSRYGGRL